VADDLGFRGHHTQFVADDLVTDRRGSGNTTLNSWRMIS
jgi:hypothetical protein